MTSTPLYMDHNATTPVLGEVVEAMLPYFTRDFGNPNSTTHPYGRRAAEAVEEARGAVARLVGARDATEICFTAGATESDNLACLGAALPRRADRPHVVTCATEHEAVLETFHAMERMGFETTVLPVDRDGRVDPDRIAQAVTDRTGLVSVMLANNETGTIHPIAEIAALCRRRGALLHTDAVQAVGRIPVRVESLGVDLLSLTAHKMYGPKGIGALWVRAGVEVTPIVHGGGQESRRRSGTLNVPGIVGLGRAAEAAMRDMDAESARQADLRDRLWEGLKARIPDIHLNGSTTHRIPGTLNVAFDGIDAEALVTALRGDVALSTGSACASGEEEGSYVIRAMHPGAEGRQRARASVRFGLGRGNGPDHVDRVVSRMAAAVERLRALAPQGQSAVKGGPRRAARNHHGEEGRS